MKLEPAGSFALYPVFVCVITTVPLTFKVETSEYQTGD